MIKEERRYADYKQMVDDFVERANRRASIENRRRPSRVESEMITEDDHIHAEIEANMESIEAMRSRRAINLLTVTRKVVCSEDDDDKYFSNLQT